MKHCEFCGKEMPEKNKRFCSLSCTAKWSHSQPEIARARYAKISAAFYKLHKDRPEIAQEASRRMKERNPMHSKETAAALSVKLKEIGHKPSVRGGNGTGPTKAEWQLMRMFPEGRWNYPVKTGMKPGSGFPTCYKLDFAFPAIKLAIEADGDRIS